MAEKKYEKRCLHITKSNIQWLRKYHNVSEPDQERPDFILFDGTERIGVEHFLIDTLWINGSQTRKSARNLEFVNAINKNDKSGGEKEIINNLTDAVSGYFNAYENFSYDTFVNNFRRIFNKHLANVPIYKCKDIDKIGFLIEISVLDFEYITTALDGTQDGTQEEKHIKGIPFTEDMWNIMNRFESIDFVFVTVLKVGSNKNKSYYFDNSHMPNILYKNFEFNPIK